MNTARLGTTERMVRVGLAVVLGLLAWEFGPTTVKGVGAIVLGAIALITGVGGFCLLDRLLVRFPTQTPDAKGPFLSLLRSPHAGMVWLAARLWVGWIWLDAGWDKIRDSAWVGSDAGTAINGYLTNASSDRMTKGQFPPVSDWYAWLIDKIFLKIDTPLSYVIAFTEVAIGLMLIFGFFTTAAAFWGAFLNLQFMLAGSLSAGENPLMFTYSLLFMVAGAAAYRYGVDRATMPRLRHAWSDRHFFTHHRPPRTPIAH
jgi:thiosulfate dehydrogenase [quinone] large subunit